MNSPTLRQFILNVEVAMDDLAMALQEARQVAEQLDEAGIANLETTLSDQIDGWGKFGNFHISLNFDSIRADLEQI
jgi:hypothetical protein